MSFTFRQLSLLFMVIAMIFVPFTLFSQASGKQLEADRLFYSGKFLEAREQYKALLDDDHDFQAGIRYFETFAKTGEYEVGIAELAKYLVQNTDNSYLLNMFGTFSFRTGKYSEAEAAYQKAAELQPEFWKNYIDAAELFKRTGRKYDALNLYRIVYNRGKRSTFRDDINVMYTAIAAAGLEEFHEANQAFGQAFKINPQNIENLRHWALLFLSKFNNADAQSTFEDALNISPNDPDLLAGYALSIQGFAGQEEFAFKSLDNNPSHPMALNILVGLSILDTNLQAAEEYVQKALNLNPLDEKSLANLASIKYLQEDSTGVEAIEAQIAEVNRSCGDFYIQIAENMTYRFRYKDALEFSRRAVEAESDNYRAYSMYGANLLRVGRIEEARRNLSYAFDRDAFDLFAKNNLELIEEYDTFEKYESEHFELSIEKIEGIILGELMLSIAEEAFDSLSLRYSYRPAGKIRLEAYHDHQDFAVRIAGIPNLELLGVCFGDIVAFDTPKARSQQEYNWSRTLWHELAHTMALGLSDHRVPRWFTEGLSVYEEKLARPEWGREMDIEFYSAHENDKLLPLENIHEGFTRPQFPGQVLLSYFQGAKIIEMIAEQYGFAAVTQMLEEFSKRKSQVEVFQTVLGMSDSEFSERFFARLDSNLENFKDVVQSGDELFGSYEVKESLTDKIFGSAKTPFFKKLSDANKLLGEDKFFEAEAKFKDALNIYANYSGPGNPYQGLAYVYRKMGDDIRLRKILVDYISVSEYAAQELRELADMAIHEDRNSYAADLLLRSFQVEPYDLEAHLKRSELLKRAEMFKEETVERKSILALKPVDRPEALLNYAVALYNAGETVKAKRQTLMALELAPGYREAQKLLLKLTDGIEN